MKKGRIIAIDGPAASGKSTVAHELAGRLSYRFIDSGAMYRAVTLLAIEGDVDTRDPGLLADVARQVNEELRFTEGAGGETRVFLGERDISDTIRSPAVGGEVSQVSAVPEVREVLLHTQRRMAGSGSVVMEGRDITTRVCPDADLKVFLDASLDERTKRRRLQLMERGMDLPFGEVKKGIVHRDEYDSGRKHSPLTVARESHYIDTTDMTVDMVVQEIIGLL